MKMVCRLTRRGYPVVFGLIVLATLVSGRQIVLSTELLFAVLTFEREEIDETTVFSAALMPDSQENAVICRHFRVFPSESEREY
jgi:hypothetical protein